jgi:hypothetical protein
MTQAHEDIPKKVLFHRDLGNGQFELQTEDASQCLGNDPAWLPPPRDIQRPTVTMSEIKKRGDALKAEGFDVTYQRVLGW